MTAITARGAEIDPSAGRPIDAIRVARSLLHTTRVAALATLDPGGYPYATVTNLLVEPDGTPAIFMAGLSLHARNIAADPRVSITLAETDRDVMVTPRLTLSGRAVQVTSGIDALKYRYVARFPKSKLYLALPDALLFRIRIEAVQLNGGPGRNANSVTPADLRAIPLAGDSNLVAGLNGDGLAGPLAKAAGAALDGNWQVTALDAEGADLLHPDRLARLWFPAPVRDAAELQAMIARILRGPRP